MFWKFKTEKGLDIGNIELSKEILSKEVHNEATSSIILMKHCFSCLPYIEKYVHG